MNHSDPRPVIVPSHTHGPFPGFPTVGGSEESQVSLLSYESQRSRVPVLAVPFGPSLARLSAASYGDLLCTLTLSEHKVRFSYLPSSEGN